MGIANPFTSARSIQTTCQVDNNINIYLSAITNSTTFSPTNSTTTLSSAKSITSSPATTKIFSKSNNLQYDYALVFSLLAIIYLF